MEIQIDTLAERIRLIKKDLLAFSYRDNKLFLKLAVLREDLDLLKSWAVKQEEVKINIAEGGQAEMYGSFYFEYFNQVLSAAPPFGDNPIYAVELGLKQAI